MKFTLALMADLPGIQTVCILLTPNEPTLRTKNSPQIVRMLVHDQNKNSEILVTAVVKGIELPRGIIASLLNRYMAQKYDHKLPVTIEIDNLNAIAQESRS